MKFLYTKDFGGRITFVIPNKSLKKAKCEFC